MQLVRFSHMSVVTAAIAGLAWSAVASATPIFTPYDASTSTPAPNPGATKPTALPTDGTWSISNTGTSGVTNTGLSFAPGVEADNVTQFWKVTDTAGTSANGGTGTTASQNYTKNFVDTVNSQQWAASVTLKVAAARGTVTANGTIGKDAGGTNITGETTNSPIFFDVRNGHTIYTLGFLQDSVTGNQGVYWAPGGGDVGTGATTSTLIRKFDLSTAYNTFKLVYTPNAANLTHAGADAAAIAAAYKLDSVDLFINNETTPAFTFNSSTVPVLGASTVTPRVQLGSASVSNTATYQFTNISFDQLPEPSSLAFIAGTAGVSLLRRRKTSIA